MLRFLPGVAALIGFSITLSPIWAQTGDPCTAVRYTAGEGWAADSTITTSPASGIKGIVACASAASTMSNIAGNTTYDPAAFPIDVSTSSCVDPSTLLPQTVANPVSGEPLLWLNFDVRAFAGTFQIQITDGNENLGWALYYAEPPFTYPALNATTGEYTSGDCDNLTFWMCGTASSSNWNTIVMPKFRVAGAFYIAIWDQAADGNITVGAFKTRNGCGGDPSYGMVELGDQRVICNGDGTYTVEQEVWGINSTLVASDPAAISSPSAQVCLSGPSGVTHDTLRISYNHGTAFDFDVDAVTTGVTAPCVVPINAGDLFFHDIAGASPADSDNDGICDSEDLCTNNTATNYTAVPSAACLFTWYLDADGDGLGNSGSSQSATSQPSGYVLDNTDLCDDNTACNYNAAVVTNAACTYATTWYADADGDGLGDSGDTQSACSQPSGYVADNTDLCDDNTACNYNAAVVTNAACTYATTWYADADGDGLGDSGDTQSDCSQPTGYVSVAGDDCPGDVSKTSAGVCGCGVVDVDVDGDGLCDSGDNCTDNTATNFASAGNEACAYSIIQTIIEVCSGASSQSWDLDALAGSGSWSYSVLTPLAGIASESLVGSQLTIDFSPSGAGVDTLEILAQDGSVTSTLCFVVREWEYPMRTSGIRASAASSHNAADGSISFQFSGTYGEPVTVHFEGGITRNTVLNALTLMGSRYSIIGYTNVKGCYMPEPATSSQPPLVTTPTKVMVPCERCE